MPTQTAQTLERALNLLTAVVATEQRNSLENLAQAAGLAPSTAHRMLLTLQRAGFVAKVGQGSYLPGPALIRLGGGRDLAALLSTVARPLLLGLARRTGLTAHLGVLEGDMVTYLVKAEGRRPLLTREAMQLEAYCSGIGKVLLAALPELALDAYLRSAPFVRLTPRTIVDPGVLRRELAAIARDGIAMDKGEFDSDLYCIAAPIRDDRDLVCAAISVSGLPVDEPDVRVAAWTADLQAAASQIERRLTARR